MKESCLEKTLLPLLLVAALGCEPQAAAEGARDATPPEDGATTAMTPVERGEYLVSTGGCNDCHTPWVMGPEGPHPDMSRLLSGHPSDMKLPPPPRLDDGPWNWVGSATMTAFAGPWGTTYSPNLTPDSATGLGRWTEETFIQAMRTGKKAGTGRPIMPPMPWPSLAAMTDEDLKAVFAYLRSIPPTENRVPGYRPPEK